MRHASLLIYMMYAHFKFEVWIFSSKCDIHVQKIIVKNAFFRLMAYLQECPCVCQNITYILRYV